MWPMCAMVQHMKHQFSNSIIKWDEHCCNCWGWYMSPSQRKLGVLSDPQTISSGQRGLKTLLECWYTPMLWFRTSNVPNLSIVFIKCFWPFATSTQTWKTSICRLCLLLSIHLIFMLMCQCQYLCDHLPHRFCQLWAFLWDHAQCCWHVWWFYPYFIISKHLKRRLIMIIHQL